MKVQPYFPWHLNQQTEESKTHCTVTTTADVDATNSTVNISTKATVVGDKTGYFHITNIELTSGPFFHVGQVKNYK